MDWTALGVSLKLAAATTLLLAALAVPLAWWLANATSRWAALVETLIAVPLVLPPTVLGFYLLGALGPRSPLGRWWEQWSGQPLVFTFTGVLIGSLIYNLPFAVQPCAAAFRGVDRRLIEAAQCLGSPSWEVLVRVGLPLAWPGLLAGLILTFAHTLGEFGVVLMVGGNLPGRTRTMSVAIYDDVQALAYDSAGRAAALLVVLALAALALVRLLQPRRHTP